jgi:hypothetical protein
MSPRGTGGTVPGYLEMYAANGRRSEQRRYFATKFFSANSQLAISQKFFR